MSKSDIYVPSCHISVQITLYISKVQYIYVQNCDMYIKIRRPDVVLYITVK